MPSQLREKIEQLPWTTPESLARVEEWSRRDTRALAEGKAQSTGSLDPVGMPAE
jgi:hypothetical protein